MLRRIFVRKREEVKGSWRKYIIKTFITCTHDDEDDHVDEVRLRL
jgi:hypothetical protein